MTYSTLYAITRTDKAEGQASVKEASKQTDEKAPASFGYIVGTLPSGEAIVHGSPGDPIPKGATVYRDGSEPWTWNAVSDEFAEMKAEVMPHEYAGEPTAAGITKERFSRIAVDVKAVDVDVVSK